MPWDHSSLEEWQIVGMNHYNLKDEMHLFVALTSGTRCITAEGTNEEEVFKKLAELADTQDFDQARLRRLFRVEHAAQEWVAADAARSSNDHDLPGMVRRRVAAMNGLVEALKPVLRCKFCSKAAAYEGELCATHWTDKAIG